MCGGPCIGGIDSAGGIGATAFAASRLRGDGLGVRQGPVGYDQVHSHHDGKEVNGDQSEEGLEGGRLKSCRCEGSHMLEERNRGERIRHCDG